MGNGCLTADVVDALLAGSLEPAAVARAEAHMDGCSHCRVLVGQVAGDSAYVIGRSDTVVARGNNETVQSVGGAALAPSEQDSVRPGDRIERYLIERKLGAGGMGIVYLADDPELKRKVVLKLLRPELVDGGTDRARMLREAQAMAQVSHANVVPVYDVGVHDEQVFLAMEYIHGVDLAMWLQGMRSQRAIIDVLVAAGRGLAAAHRAGLVHRDFKPHNVLIANTGEVKVTDFGLARAELATSTAASDKKPTRERPRLESPLTQTGALVGTPAYMAPEQILCDAVDARTDQFSFCVTLYEALYKERPFAGKTVAELFDSTLEGKLSSAVANSRSVPRQVREAIRRGLQVDPERRHASMDALLAELAPRSRRSIAIAALAALATLTVTGVTLYAMRSPVASCTVDAPSADLWPAARRATLARATHESVASRVDAWLVAWNEAASDVCIDARAGAVVRMRRRRCLQDAVTRLDASLVQLSRGAKPMEAHLALEDLIQPWACSAAMVARQLEPTPQQVLLMQPLRAKLLAGGSQSTAVVARWFEDARAIGYVPFITEVAEQLATLQAKSETPQTAVQTLRDTAALAERAGDDLSWISVNIGMLGYLRGAGAAEIDAIGEAVRARIAKLGSSRELEGTLDMYLGFAFQTQNRLDDEIQVLERARGAFRVAYGPSSMREAFLLYMVAAAYRARDGSSSRDAARSWARAAAVYRRLGVSNPPGLMFDQDPKQMVAQLTEMLAAVVAEEPESATVATYENALAGALVLSNDLPGALAHVQRAVEIRDRLGVRDRVLGSSLVRLADVSTRLHRAKEAIAPARRAIELGEQLGDDEMVVDALTSYGRALLESGDDAAALAPLQRADAMGASGPKEVPRVRGDRRFLLAQASWPTSHARARELAHAARSDLESALAILKPDSPGRAWRLADIAEIDHWLARHR